MLHHGLSSPVEEGLAKVARDGSKVRLDQDGESFRVSRSDLTLSADVPRIDESRLRELAEEAKRNCPISKLLNAEMALDVKVGQPA